MYQSTLRFIAIFLTLGAFMFSCQPDNVAPKDEVNNGSPSLAADENNPHPILDPVCSRYDTIPLATADGNRIVNFCGAFGGQAIPCPPGFSLEWGYIEIMNGVDEIAFNITMAPGWFVDKDRSRIDLEGNYGFDQNGIPSGGDWLSRNIDPVVNRTQIRYNISDLPGNCAAAAIQLTVLKLDFFGGPVPGSESIVYAYNEEWNDSQSLLSSSSPFLVPWCIASCGPDPVDCSLDYKTWSQCQYGICGGNNPASTYRDANFASAFPSGLTLGCTTGFTASFSDAQAINNFLPTAGGLGVLNQSYTNPTGRVGGNTNFNFCADWNANQACGTVDFNTDGVLERGGGNALAAGTFVTNQWQDDLGMTISGESNNANRPGQVIIFDSNNPTGGDWDLGTPNQAFGGPGQGSAGASGPGVNNVNEGNLIILAENVNDGNGDGIVDNPDDDAAGGVITFDFATPITIQAVTMVDLDDNANNRIKLYFADNRAPLTISVPQIGNNSRKVILTKESDNSWADQVVKVEVVLSGSGAIAGLCFCDENPYTNNACVQRSGSADIRSTLAGRLTTAMLNVGFDAYDDNFANANFPLGFMEIRNGVFGGMTVNEVIEAANEVLGGCSTAYTKQQLNSALNKINKSFLNGARRNNYLVCPSI
ncbi:MAG: hypothetical protein AAF998_23775 [Bacteroidota bacterium]